MKSLCGKVGQWEKLNTASLRNIPAYSEDRHNKVADVIGRIMYAVFRKVVYGEYDEISDAL